MKKLEIPPYTRIPTWLFEYAELHTIGALLYSVLLALYLPKRKQPNYSEKTLSGWLGVSERTIRSAVKLLQEVELLKVTSALGERNKYEPLRLDMQSWYSIDNRFLKRRDFTVAEKIVFARFLKFTNDKKDTMQLHLTSFAKDVNLSPNTVKAAFDHFLEVKIIRRVDRRTPNVYQRRDYITILYYHDVGETYYDGDRIEDIK